MNKITEKQKCIAEQAVYGDLYCQVPDDSENYLLRFYKDNVCTLKDMDLTGLFKKVFDDVKPILRPPSDLAKSITHKGYNDDKPFIPLVELAKIQYKDFECHSIEIIDDISIICKGYSKMLSKQIMKENVKYNCAYWFHPLSSERCDEERDLLNLWHFDTRNLIPTGEAVDVNSLEVNPYEV